MANKQEIIEAVRKIEGGRRGEANYVRLDKLLELIEREWPLDSGNMNKLIQDFIIQFPDTLHHDIVVGVNDVLTFLKKYSEGEGTQ